MRLLIKNIKGLYQVEKEKRLAVCGEKMKELPAIDNAYLIVEEGFIHSFGKMEDLKETNAEKVIDAQGRYVLPTFCDSHTHLVYSGSREIEYIDKIRGLSYTEIAQRGGGIVNSAIRVQKASEQELYEDSMQRIDSMIKHGTGAIEIKSGYGFTTEAELKMLRVIRKIKETSPATIKANFLGAHGIPLEYRENVDKFVNLIIDDMIPRVCSENLANFIDVFCDKGFFTVEQTDRMLFAGVKAGLKPKIHANELAKSGGIQVGVKYNALSVDHIEYTEKEEIDCLKASQTMPTILPGAAFFLNMQCAPAKQMIAAGLPIAMASDFNPGSSPNGNMQLILTFACVNYKLTPQQAINATTINSAYAMDVVDELGSICVGKRANFFITKKIPTIEYIPYYYGENKVDKVILNGKEY